MNLGPLTGELSASQKIAYQLPIVEIRGAVAVYIDCVTSWPGFIYWLPAV